MTMLEYWQEHGGGDISAALILLPRGTGLVTKNILRGLMECEASNRWTDYYRGKLLQALARVPYEPVARPQIQTPNLTPAVEDAPLSSNAARALHKEHSHVHALLVNAATDAARAEYAREIIEKIIPALDAEYDRLRADAGEVNPSDDLRKRRHVVRTRIRQIKNDLNKPLSQERKKTLTKALEKYEAEYKLLNEE